MKRILCSLLVAALPFGSVSRMRRSRRTQRGPSSISTRQSRLERTRGTPRGSRPLHATASAVALKRDRALVAVPAVLPPVLRPMATCLLVYFFGFRRESFTGS